MDRVIVKPNNAEELQFLVTLLKKLDIDSQVMNEEELEDLGLLLAMKEADRNERVSDDAIMAKLRSKL